MSLRVALIGFGLAGESFHAPFVATTPGLRLASVVTASPERQARARAAHPGAELVEIPQDVLTPDRSDLVVVATPNRTHAELAHAALDAGLPVVVDKPVGRTAAEARELVEHARRAGVPLVPFHNRRWDGDLLTLRDLLAAGRLGPVHRLESRFERFRPEVAASWREHADPADAGGVLMDLGPHLVDQALLLLGPVTDLHAEVRAVRPGARVPDDAFLALTHEGGAVSHLHMSAVAAHLGPRFRALGRDGAFVSHGLDPQEAALRAGGRPDAPGFGEAPDPGELHAAGGVTPVPLRPGRYAEFYAALSQALVHGGPLPVEPQAALAVAELLDAARSSASRTN